MSEANAYVPEPDVALKDGTPTSQTFEDVYFSRDGGVEETAYVFLQGNGLQERWADARRFTIAELGFGTGLNFLVALQRFRATAAKEAVLHYISIEKYPFTAEHLRALLALQPEVVAEAEELLQAYPLRLPGVHRLYFPQAVLTLCVGDASEMLAEITTPVDAWFLDGFSPAKNPDMWSEELFTRVGALSNAGATFSTFTAAGHVKRGLMAAGFAVEKIPGFGHKRDMLIGSKAIEGGIVPHAVHSVTHQQHVIVIGAGIAGATLARALGERGDQVTVLERDDIASGASGNAAGVLFPQLTKRWNPSTAWYFTAYSFMLCQLQYWRAQGLNFDHAAPGMLRVPRHAEEAAQLATLNETLGLDASIVQWLDRDAASVQAGIPLTTGAAYFPRGTWLNAASLCRSLLRHERIMLRSNAQVAALSKQGAQWQVTLADGKVILADAVCVAAAGNSTNLLQEYGLRLNHVGGQVSEIAAHDVAQPLRSILCHKGYVVPLGERYLIGATYHREAMHDVTEARHEENIAELHHALPGWFTGAAVAGRSSLRATTPDRMPYAGKLDDGLYVSTGHGSRGLLSAPLAAEMIASMMHQEQSPVSAALARAVNPKRFTAA